MILIIVGAGASFDSIAARPLGEFSRRYLSSRPPLADELFLSNELHDSIVEKFPQCRPILPYLQHLPADVSLEQVLQQLQEETTHDHERLRQMAAIRYYLQVLIERYGREWSKEAAGATNYITLIDQIRRSRLADEAVCLVTFNYDLMLDWALQSVGIFIRTLQDYVERPDFKLFKVHGSTNWGREIVGEIRSLSRDSRWDIAREIIGKIEDIEVTNVYRIVNETPVVKSGEVPMFPAIAIPTERKSGFECPKGHLSLLNQLLPSTSKIISIGWRGMETTFLTMLKECLMPYREITPLCAVNGTANDAAEVITRFNKAGIAVQGHPEGGFSTWIARRGAEKFLTHS